MTEPQASNQGPPNPNLLFPKLSDIASNQPHMVDSNASISSETSDMAREEYAVHVLNRALGRQSSNLSTISSVSNISASNGSNNNNNMTTSSKKKKKRATIWSEKYENTAVVIGPVANHERFKDLIALVKEKSGEVKSHYFREEQRCGFIYFHDDQIADKCKTTFHGFEFGGAPLKAKSPSTFFDNQDEVFPELDHPKIALVATPAPSLTVSSPIDPTSSQEPTPTLVIKNLCFGLKQERLLEFMAALKSPPQSVSYHYDNNGLFRGVAFAKYNTAEQAAESLTELDGKEIGGRKLRVEFKRRTSSQMPMSLSPTKQLSFNSLSPLPSSMTKDIFDVRRSYSPQTRVGVQGPIPTILLSDVDSKFSRSLPTNEAEMQTPPRNPHPTTPTPTPTQPQATPTTTTAVSPVATPTTPTPSRGAPLLPSPPPNAIKKPMTPILETTPSVTPTTTPTPTASSRSHVVPPPEVHSIFSATIQTPAGASSAKPPPPPAEMQSIFKGQPPAAIVIRDGQEFEEIVARNSQASAPTGPPPVTSLKCSGTGSVLPVLRAGLEFA